MALQKTQTHKQKKNKKKTKITTKMTKKMTKKSPGCLCWTDDMCGSRISRVIEHSLEIPLREQGYIMQDKVIDYIDPEFGNLLWNVNEGKIILYQKF